MIKSLVESLLPVIGYDKTHITRTVAYREIDRLLDALGTETHDALEISAGWKWRARAWNSFSEMNWPEYDICEHRLDRQFDIIIADNVFEHLKYPYRAAQNVRAMLKSGGYFINITPFMIRHHPIPLDCSRWTQEGMRYFLEEVGFDPEKITTGGWGNAAAVRANMHRWARTGWKRNPPNDPNFPVTIWAIAEHS